MLLSERRKIQKAHWELFKTRNLVEAVHKAKDLGWAEKKVQVKGIQVGVDNEGDEIIEYTIEPFERDCSCPNILKYVDYFLPPIEEDLTLT